MVTDVKAVARAGHQGLTTCSRTPLGHLAEARVVECCCNHRLVLGEYRRGWGDTARLSSGVRPIATVWEYTMRAIAAAMLGLMTTTYAAAQPASRPIVGELFTSEGCSSCPPADAKIAELARTRPDLLLLTFHVTYWNNLGWQDPFSFAAATQRQQRYVAAGTSPEVYTPALIVEGKLDAVGSDTAAVDHALQQAAQSAETLAQIVITRVPSGLAVSVGAGAGHGTILLLGFDRLHQTHVGRGENNGRTLEEANIVRSMALLGQWSGRPLQIQTPYPAGQDVAVLLQRDDGRIVGAGVARAPAGS